MAEQTAAEHELAELIVSSLDLEEVSSGQIDPEEPLFGGDLGLDSIDALEISLAVARKYGVQLRADNDDNKQAFSNLRALNRFIEEHQPPA